MKSRKDFPNYLNDLGLTGEGVEVGVHVGEFSEEILKTWRGQTLYSVDSWTHQGNKLDKSDGPQYEHDLAFLICRERLKIFKARSMIIKKPSIEAATVFDDNSLDFVYIDARHDYRSVTADLMAWYKKVKVGGIISGHDYKNSFVRRNLVEVARAVNDFFYDIGRVSVTTEDNIPSFFWRKKI